MYFFIEKYKISHQMVKFPWKELPDFHIFSHHDHKRFISNKIMHQRFT